MSFEHIITYIVLPVFSAFGAIWVLIAKVIVPYVLKDRSDKREFKQDTESLAFKQAINITDRLISALLKELEDKKAIEEMLRKLTTERFRDAEIQADMDIMFHRIIEILQKKNDKDSIDNNSDNSVSD